MPTERSTKLVTARFGNEKREDPRRLREAAAATQTLRKALAMRPEDITAEVKASNLRGRGGAGFATGVKWGFVPQGRQEGPPRLQRRRVRARHLQGPRAHVLGSAPPHRGHDHLGARAASAEPQLHLHPRRDDARVRRARRRPSTRPTQRGYLGKNILGTGVDVHLTVHRGAGAYICGEETALLNSLEGLRGQPRLKPPFPAVKGLFGNPTIVNNVETLMNVPCIVDKGGAWFNGLGMGRSGGTRIAVRVGPRREARRVRAADGHHVPPDHRRGLRRRVEGPQGQGRDPGRRVDAAARRRRARRAVRVRRAPDRRAHQARAWSAPASSSTSAAASALRTMAGSGGVVVMDDQTDIPKAVWRIMKFFAHESCGQCTPCREGTGWLEKVARRVADGNGKPGDLDLLGVDRARHRRQHDLRARRRRGVADARLPDQVPRRLRGQDPAEGGVKLVALRSLARDRAAPSVLACFARPALAQPAPAAQRRPRRRHRAGAGPGIVDPSASSAAARRHRRVARQAGMALLFWAFAAATIGGALFVITRRNLIAAVMGMVGSFLGIAAVYMMLYASFLAVIQMLVYAGAIMVLFVFVIMILNRPEDEPVAPTGRVGQVLGGVAILYLVGRLAMLLVHVDAAERGDRARVARADRLPRCGRPDPSGRLGLGAGRRQRPVRRRACSRSRRSRSCCSSRWSARSRSRGRSRTTPPDTPESCHEEPAVNDILFDVGYGHFLVLAAVLFLIGMAGVLVRRNALIILMSIELMLNAANMTLITFSRMWGDAARAAHTFALIVIARRRRGGLGRPRDRRRGVPRPAQRRRRPPDDAEALTRWTHSRASSVPRAAAARVDPAAAAARRAVQPHARPPAVAATTVHIDRDRRRSRRVAGIAFYVVFGPLFHALQGRLRRHRHQRRSSTRGSRSAASRPSSRSGSTRCRR